MLYYPQCWAHATLYLDSDDENEIKSLIVDKLRPTSATVHRNGYMLADTFEMSFAVDDLPIRPDTIRAMQVELFMFHTEQLEQDPTAFLTADNRVFVGLVDDPEWSLGSSGKTFSVNGRDFTQLFIDRPWPADTPIEMLDTLEETIQAIVTKVQTGKLIGKHDIETARSRAASATLTSNTAANVLEVVDISLAGLLKTEKFGQTDKALTQKSQKSANKTKVKGRSGSRTTKTRRPVQSGRNVWDVITELCQFYGRIVYVEQDQIIIHDPAILTESAKNDAAYVAYGRNLSTLNIKKKLGKNAPVNLVASYYDPTTKAVITVQYPEKGNELAKSYGSNVQNFKRVTLPPGMHDQELARTYLRGRYAMDQKGETEISFDTKSLRGLKGNSQSIERDLLQLRAGDPVAIGIDTVERRTIAEQRDPDLRYRYLINAGLREAVARVLADHYGKYDELRRFYYTKEASFSWSITDGMTISATAQNYARKGNDAAKLSK